MVRTHRAGQQNEVRLARRDWIGIVSIAATLLVPLFGQGVYVMMSVAELKTIVKTHEKQLDRLEARHDP